MTWRSAAVVAAIGVAACGGAGASEDGDDALAPDGGVAPDAGDALAPDAGAPAPVLGTGPITDYEWAHPTLERNQPFDGTSNYASCVDREVPPGFPDRANDDYLHDEKYAGFEHLGLMTVDHCLYRKVVNTIMPALRETTPDITWCGIDYVIRNPRTGEVMKIYDIYNYRDADGEPAVLNINREVFGAWPALLEEGPTVNLAIRVRHVATGADASNGHEDIGATLDTAGLP